MLEMSLQENEFDTNNFLLWWLLKEIQGDAEDKLYTFILEMLQNFRKPQNTCYINLIAISCGLEISGWLSQGAQGNTSGALGVLQH